MPIGLKKATPLRSGKKSSPMKWRRQEKARENVEDLRGDLQDSIADFRYMELSNVYEGTQNAFAGFGAGNRILGMQNPFEGIATPQFQTEFENKIKELYALL